MTGFGYEHDDAWATNIDLFKEFTDVSRVLTLSFFIIISFISLFKIRSYSSPSIITQVCSLSLIFIFFFVIVMCRVCAGLVPLQWTCAMLLLGL